jgi:hypothetical protein
MYRTYVILRHTFFEAIVQPIYSLLLAIGVAILVIFGLLPFFTLGEDTLMFKAVGLDIILLLVLIATLFATSKSIFDEIEDRTMLTLMSKPVQKWQVLVGKYLGIILAALLAVAISGGDPLLCTYLRIPGDYQLRTNVLDERDVKRLADYRTMHIAGLVPQHAPVVAAGERAGGDRGGAVDAVLARGEPAGGDHPVHRGQPDALPVPADGRGRAAGRPVDRRQGVRLRAQPCAAVP